MAHPKDVRLHASVPAFVVADVDATAAWYARYLGYRVAGVFPTQPPSSWASLQRDGSEIMLQRLAGDAEHAVSLPGAGAWHAYFRLNGVHALYRTIAHEPFVRMALRRQPYGDWEFEVVDPNGYVLVFGGDQAVGEDPPPD